MQMINALVVRHNTKIILFNERHVQFLTSTPNFKQGRGQLTPHDPALPSPRNRLNSKVNIGA